MKQTTITLTIVMLIAIILVSLGTWHLNSELSAIEDQCKEYMGAKVVLQGDTLEVVDYSVFFNQFTLSNLKTVNTEYVIKKAL